MKELVKELAEKAELAEKNEGKGKENFLRVCQAVCRLCGSKSIVLSSVFGCSDSVHIPQYEIVYFLAENKLKKINYHYSADCLNTETEDYEITKRNLLYLFSGLKAAIRAEIRDAEKVEKIVTKLQELLEILES